MMSLTKRESLALGSIAHGLAGSDPRLASMLGIFSRLTSGKETRPGRRVAASAGADARRQQADARAAAHRAAVRRGGRRHDDDRTSRRVEREGQARAGVAPGAPELAAGVRSGMTGVAGPLGRSALTSWTRHRTEACG